MESFKRPVNNELLHLLTKRETEIAGLFLQKDSAIRRSPKNFSSAPQRWKHINNIYQKLHVQSRTDAINKVFGERS